MGGQAWGHTESRCRLGPGGANRIQVQTGSGNQNVNLEVGPMSELSWKARTGREQSWKARWVKKLGDRVEEAEENINVVLSQIEP